MRIEHRWMARMLAEAESCNLPLPWNRNARKDAPKDTPGHRANAD